MRSMRGSTSAVNGFPLIWRVIFRFICTQPLVWGAVYDGDECFGKMQGGGSGALRAPVLGSGFWVLAPVVRDWADLCGVVRRGRRFGPDAKLDEQSRYRWNQRSWRAGRCLSWVTPERAKRVTVQATHGDENGCRSAIEATVGCLRPRRFGSAARGFSCERSQFSRRSFSFILSAPFRASRIGTAGELGEKPFRTVIWGKPRRDGWVAAILRESVAEGCICVAWGGPPQAGADRAFVEKKGRIGFVS